MANILVVGGAGYIGSHMVLKLLEHNHQVVVYDDLSTGHRGAVFSNQFIEASTSEKEKLEQTFDQYQFDAVMHFAASIQVGESVEHPQKYYFNNVVNTLTLLSVMLKYNVKHFIFSSTAAIFGEPQYFPIDTRHPINPVNPYGHTKRMIETILGDYDRAYGLKSACLRYFNAAGADPETRTGEQHNPESHLIPLVLKAANRQLTHVNIFGNNYDTPDGTCIRDYIHVDDLCKAHLLALEKLWADHISFQVNLGNGQGFSVQEVIDTVKKVTGKTFAVIDAPRRDGDPARLIADSEEAKALLGWQPRYASLEKIILDAWNWELTLTTLRYAKATF